MESPIRLAESQDLERVQALMAEFYAESGYPLERAPAAAGLTKPRASQVFASTRSTRARMRAACEPSQ